MNTHDFIACYGGIYEHSPWVAEQIAPLAAGIDDADQLAELMADCVDNAAEDRQLALIRAHPDLAGNAHKAGELTADSTAEQASAGLHQCSKVQYEKFQALNDAYKEKFGFEIHKIARLRLGAVEKDA
jgi:OHCU decarboxylase